MNRDDGIRFALNRSDKVLLYLGKLHYYYYYLLYVNDDSLSHKLNTHHNVNVRLKGTAVAASTSASQWMSVTSHQYSIR